MHRSTAWPLSWVYAGLMVYASLYPFGPWRGSGATPWAYWWAPWPRYWTGFDVAVNLVGYAPWGALLAVGLLRIGRAHAALWLPALMGLALSASLEALQTFLPGRIPSREDCLLNTLGAALGAWAVWRTRHWAVWARWGSWRAHWLVTEARGGLTLLLLWPVALLFPAPVPFGLGQVLERMHAALQEWVQDSRLAQWWPPAPAPEAPLSPAAQAWCVFLGLLAVQLLACTVLRSRTQRWAGMAVLVLAGVLATALSSALSWGPEHAWAWVDGASLVGLGLALAVGTSMALAPWRFSAALALLVLAMLLVALNQAPPSPYFAQTLQEWERGRFIRFHGLAQWLGWLWPYACAVYLLARLGGADAKK
ncbi:MAG: VanZ family protein [Rhodoferax sp.]